MKEDLVKFHCLECGVFLSRNETYKVSSKTHKGFEYQCISCLGVCERIEGTSKKSIKDSLRERRRSCRQ